MPDNKLRVAGHRRRKSRDGDATSGVGKRRIHRVSDRDVDRFIPADAGRDQERAEVKDFLALHPEYRKDIYDEPVKPIRLGGSGGNYVVKLPDDDLLDQCPPAVTSSLRQNPEYWRELLASLGFTDDESTYLILNKLDRVSICDLHRAVSGWTTATVERLRKSISAKLKTIAASASSTEIERVSGTSLVLAYHEQLPSGQRVHGLADVILSPVFQEEMSRSLTKSQPVNQLPASINSRHKYRKRIMIFKIKELDTRITSERQKLDDLVLKSHEADAELIRARSHLESLQLKSKTELEEFIVDNSLKLDPKLPQQIEATAQRIVEAHASIAAFKVVIAKQQQIVDDLELQWMESRRAALTLEIAEPAKIAIRELHRIAPLFAELNKIAAKYKSPLLAGDLFPDLIGKPEDVDYQLRCARETELQAIRPLIALGYIVEDMRKKGWAE